MRDLFFNTPARAKFRKSEATETANVSEAMLRLALAHPGAPTCGCASAGASRWICRPTATWANGCARRSRAAGAGALHEAEGEEGGCRVRAFLAGPDESTNTTRDTFLFVGGRFVRDRDLLHALALGYGPLLEKGRYPMAALFIDVPGADVDVNVHPQKLEVRFARAQEVYAAVRHVVGAAIARAPWLRTTDDAARCERSRSRRARRAPAAARAAGPRRRRRDGAAASGAERAAAARARSRTTSSPARDAARRSVVAWQAPRFFAGLNYVGQVHRTYLVCEAADELILIDQHAAHERVAYARLRAAHARRQMPRQQLLFPIPIEVGEAAAAALETDDVLGALGFEVARQGPGGDRCCARCPSRSRTRTRSR